MLHINNGKLANLIAILPPIVVKSTLGKNPQSIIFSLQFYVTYLEIAKVARDNVDVLLLSDMSSFFCNMQVTEECMEEAMGGMGGMVGMDLA